MAIVTVCIILVEPEGQLNIGSVCRSMMNFGFADLRLVNPQTDYLAAAARNMAVNAGSILEQATLFQDLASAVADCSLAIGATRRFGKYRDEFWAPEQAAEHILSLPADKPVALVFGRESSGLTTRELDLCQRLIFIPVSDELPSLNLAQAVSLCLYEIFKNSRQGDSAGLGQSRELASGKSLEQMFQQMRHTLLDLGFLDRNNPDHIMRAFRRIFGRAELDEWEVSILRGLWSDIERLVQDVSDQKGD
ncbi:MAG: RNA methyltransferase [Proteobacteria bacterium]|nr:RNA methyltransferase [Pseudomonadota bacterium]MBU1714539.1 RNA methyltransferase [Pseudomonadota bacterium]